MNKGLFYGGLFVWVSGSLLMFITGLSSNALWAGWVVLMIGIFTD